jgi:hypothetical protein
MHRLLIVAASAAFIALSAAAAPVMADEYPPCTHHDQDHCREVGHQSSDYPAHHHHHHHGH